MLQRTIGMLHPAKAAHTAIIVLLAMLLALVVGVAPAGAAPSQQGGGLAIALVPGTATATVGEEFTLSVEVRAGGQVIDGASSFLNFDPAVLEVVSTTPNTSLLDTVVVSTFNNTLGEVDYAAGNLFPPTASGTFTILTVRLRAKAASGGASITFNTASPRQTAALIGGSSIVSVQTSGATVAVSGGATVVGVVSINGWMGSLAGVPVRVRIVPSSGGAAVHDASATLDVDGNFSISGITAGTYHVWVKHLTSLAGGAADAAIAAGANTIGSLALRGGDANNENVVNIQDFSILAGTFGRLSSDAAYDGRADFNGDTVVNITDFSLLAINFGQQGNLTGAP